MLNQMTAQLPAKNAKNAQWKRHKKVGVMDEGKQEES